MRLRRGSIRDRWKRRQRFGTFTRSSRASRTQWGRSFLGGGGSGREGFGARFRCRYRLSGRSRLRGRNRGTRWMVRLRGENSVRRKRWKYRVGGKGW